MNRVTKRVGILHFAVLAIVLHSLPATAQDAAGSVVFLRGSATAARGDSSRPLQVGSEIAVGDEIRTAKDTRVVLKMRDGTTLALGEHTRFAVWRYDFDQSRGVGKIVLGLITGAFRAITGAIGEVEEPDLRVVTPVATLGIRGTDFWGGFTFGTALDVALLGGEGIYIQNEAGQVEITEVGFGTTVASATSAPSTPKQWGDEKLTAAAQSTNW